MSTYNASALVDEVYPDVPCPADCYPLIASHLAVPVVQYATTTGRDFALGPAGSIGGLVTNGTTGAPLLSAFVNIYARAAGRVVVVAQKQPDAAGFYTVPNLSAGTYWAMGSAFEHLRAQVFENIPCPEPDCGSEFVATGTPIVVEPPTPYTGVNFSLMPPALPPRAPFDVAAITSGFRVRVSWRPNPLGSAPTGYILEAGFAPGMTAAHDCNNGRVVPRGPRSAAGALFAYASARPTPLASARPRMNTPWSSTAMAPASPDSP